MISFPICFCQTTPFFLTSFTLCFVTWVAGFNKTMDVTKGEHDLPRRIFKLWYWVHRVWPRIIDNVVLMKIPSLDVIKFAHFDIHWKKRILIVFDDSNAQYHSDTVRNCSLRCLWEQKVIPVSDVTTPYNPSWRRQEEIWRMMEMRITPHPLQETHTAGPIHLWKNLTIVLMFRLRLRPI